MGGGGGFEMQRPCTTVGAASLAEAQTPSTWLRLFVFLNFFGFPSVLHADISHIPIISENKFDIPGEVKKSPVPPKGIFDE